MAGFHPDVALAEEGRGNLAALESWGGSYSIRGVSQFGCVVTLRNR
jgi:hypothetical protein